MSKPALQRPGTPVNRRRYSTDPILQAAYDLLRAARHLRMKKADANKADRWWWYESQQRDQAQERYDKARAALVAAAKGAP